MNTLGKCFFCGLCLSVNLVGESCLGMNKVNEERQKNDKVLRITSREQLLTCTPRRDIESVYVENVNFDEKTLDAWLYLTVRTKIYNVCSFINCSFKKGAPCLPGSLYRLIVKKCSLTSQQAKELLKNVADTGYWYVDLSDNNLGEDEDCFYFEVIPYLQRACPGEINLSGNGFQKRNSDFLEGTKIIF